MGTQAVLEGDELLGRVSGEALGEAVEQGAAGLRHQRAPDHGVRAFAVIWVVMCVFDDAERSLRPDGGVLVDDHRCEERDLSFGVPGAECADESQRVDPTFAEEEGLDFEVGDGAGSDTEVGDGCCVVVTAAKGNANDVPRNLGA